jgi:hypothetical protein
MYQTIRVPIDGRWWLSRAGCIEGGAGHSVASVLRAPAGRVFDAVELSRPVGQRVLEYFLSNRRHLGPVLLDAGVLRFLIAPQLSVRLMSLCAQQGIPAGLLVPLSATGRDIIVPAMVTSPAARVHWLIVPRTGQPRLTAIEDLIAALSHHIASQAAPPAVAAEVSGAGLLVATR